MNAVFIAPQDTYTQRMHLPGHMNRRPSQCRPQQMNRLHGYVAVLLGRRYSLMVQAMVMRGCSTQRNTTCELCFM
jgi:hypothetical protein